MRKWERIGPNWTEADKLIYEQVCMDLSNDANLKEKMQANSKEQVKPLFENEAMNAFVTRHKRNEKIVGDFIQDAKMCKLIIATLLDEVYGHATA